MKEHNKKKPSIQECCKMFDIVDAYLCSVKEEGWTWEGAAQYIQEHWEDEDFNVNYNNIIKQYKTT